MKSRKLWHGLGACGINSATMRENIISFAANFHKSFGKYSYFEVFFLKNYI